MGNTLLVLILELYPRIVLEVFKAVFGHLVVRQVDFIALDGAACDAQADRPGNGRLGGTDFIDGDFLWRLWFTRFRCH